MVGWGGVGDCFSYGIYLISSLVLERLVSLNAITECWSEMGPNRMEWM